MRAHDHENLHFDPFSFGGRVRKRCSMFAWIVISMVAYVVSIHKYFIKVTTLLILTWFLEHAWLLGNNRKMQSGLI